MITKDIHIGSFKNEPMNFAPLLVQTACKYESTVELIYGSNKINAKSIMGVMALILKPDSNITINANGADESAAVDAMVNYINDFTK